MDVQTHGLFYNVVFQDILMYRYNTWVIAAPMLDSLEGVHMGFSRGVSQMHPRRCRGGIWE